MKRNGIAVLYHSQWSNMGAFLVNNLLVLEGSLPEPERRDEIANISQ